MMNKQEVFNKVSEHLIAQGCKSIGPASAAICSYRSSGGRKCAIGCLIPDEMYKLDMDSRSVNVICLLAAYPEISSLFSEDMLLDTRFLSVLQRTHDRYPVEEWKTQLIKVGTEYQLSIPECLK